MPMLGLMKLDNPIQHYAWGSKAIARLQGRQAATEPEAELWIGAHSQAPSAVTVAGLRVTLDRLVADRPTEMLGPAAQRFGRELPFLPKVLAVAEPLSIQDHPSLVQAAEGFAREQAGRHRAGAPSHNATTTVIATRVADYLFYGISCHSVLDREFQCDLGQIARQTHQAQGLAEGRQARASQASASAVGDGLGAAWGRSSRDIPRYRE